MTVPTGGNKHVRVSISSSSIPSSSMIQIPSRTLLKTILKTLLKIIFKLWKWASSFVIVFFFAAWFYGGVLPYLIFLAAFLIVGESLLNFGHNHSNFISHLLFMCSKFWRIIERISLIWKMSQSNNNNNSSPEKEAVAGTQIKDDDILSVSSWSSLSSAPRSSSPSRSVSISRCFPFCPLPRIFPENAARLLLRNMVVPKDMWDEFPNGLSYHITDYFLYQPDMPKDSRLYVESPTRYMMAFEDVWIHTKDRVKIHGYLVKQDRRSKVPTIIFFHGNAGNIGHRLENVKLFYYTLHCNVLMVEYRGYGRSEGIPSEKGLYADAQAAFEYIESRSDLDPKRIIIFGRSLGGAVAIDLAARCDFRDRVAALIVENTFTSIPSLAKVLFQIAILRWLPSFCYKNRFESLQKIGSIVCPTLFISGTNDELLPPGMMNELYCKCAANGKLLQRFPGTHNDTWTCKDYTVKIGEFIDGLSAKGQRKSEMSQPYSDNIV